MFGETSAGLAAGMMETIRREIRGRRVGLLRVDEVAAAVGMPVEVVAPLLRELEDRGDLVVAPLEGSPRVIALPPLDFGPRARL